MRKMITCSFDPSGVVITAWNGVHPDRPGHFSVTKMMSREEYNEACKNRHLFDDVLGIKVSEGWAQAVADATKNASNLKIDPKSGLNILMEAIIMKHGPEKAKEIFAELEKQNADIEAALEAELAKEPEPKKEEPATTEGGTDGGPDRTAKTGKGGKKSGRTTAAGTPDEGSASTAA